MLLYQHKNHKLAILFVLISLITMLKREGLYVNNVIAIFLVLSIKLHQVQRMIYLRISIGNSFLVATLSSATERRTTLLTKVMKKKLKHLPSTYFAQLRSRRNAYRSKGIWQH